MKKRLFLLTMVLVMFMCGGFSLAEQAEVGGDSLDECVQRMVGYTIETGDEGGKTINYSNVAFEYYVERSENGAAVLPTTVNVMDISLNLVSFVAPGLSTITEIDVMTDDMLYQIILNDELLMSDKSRGFGKLCNEELTEVLNAMYHSENVTLRFFENGTDYKDFALGEQQMYLLKQYGYTVENFIPKTDTKSFLYKYIMGYQQFDYTIKKTELDSSTAGVKNK